LVQREQKVKKEEAETVLLKEVVVVQKVQGSKVEVHGAALVNIEVLKTHAAELSLAKAVAGDEVCLQGLPED